MSTPRKPVHAKVVASGVAGSWTVLVVFIARQFGLDIPPDVAAALTVVAGFAGGWLRTP